MADVATPIGRISPQQVPVGSTPGGGTPQTPVDDFSGGGGGSADFSRIRNVASIFSGSRDIVMALGIIMVISVLIFPLPRMLLDIALAFSFSFSVLILLTAVFIERPLEFNAFPSVLLIATMIRLSLNMASTRLILANGHQGLSAAGEVIRAFGKFIMQGNFVIGIIIFSILIIVNFIVITKGSTRIAEVAARFSLDAMPGKQMAIDADLSTGLINEEQARERRTILEAENSFYGTMDGASKFVRGDTVAGLIITFINIIGGIIIGVVQHGMTFSAAANTFTRLTVGDGLVSQIPALLVSVAAGLLVTKSGLTETSNELVFRQLSQYPKTLILSSGLLGVMGLLPGMPFVPFFLLGASIGAGAYFTWRRQRDEQKETERESLDAMDNRLDPNSPEYDPVLAKQREDGMDPAVQLAHEPPQSALKMDVMRLELGYSLLGLVEGDVGQRLTDRVKALRRELASEMGFIMPSVRIQDNLQLPSKSYAIYIKEVAVTKGEVSPGKLMVLDSKGKDIALPGERTVEPTFGLPAVWTPEENRGEAVALGYTVVEPSSVITTHLTEVVRNNMSDLLSYSATQELIDEQDEGTQKLIKAIIPSQVTVTLVHRILQNLLSERVSIRDMPSILEGIAEATVNSTSVTFITDVVRMHLSRQICAHYFDGEETLPVVTLSPKWEETFKESLIPQEKDYQLHMPPDQVQAFMTAVQSCMEKSNMEGHMPVIVTSPFIRRFVFSLVDRFRPGTAVLSQDEVHSRIKVRILAQI